MSDSFHSLSVVLAQDMRADDAEATIAAIKQIRGVLDVSGEVADMSTHMAQTRARDDIAEKLWKVLYPKGY